RLINSLQNLSSYTDLENVLDTDEVLRYFVVHNFVCNGDSYTGMMIHNYYLHESDGKLSMIPWDYNLAFGTFQGGDASGTINTSIDSPISMGNVDDRPMLGWIFSDESYTKQYHELFAEFIEKWFTNGELEQLIADTAEMIRPYVEKDPTKFCTLDEFDKGVETLSQFVSLRAEAVRRQLNGDETAAETGDLNASDMGSMGGGMGKDKGGFPGAFGKTEKTSDEDGENGTEEATVSETTESEVPQQNNESGMSFPGAFPERDGESQDSKSGEKSEDGSESGFSGGSFSPPDGFSPPGGATGGQSDESEQNFRILIAVSSLVLAIGIFIAAKKKY
ncbi:MAG: CotH kinase family protein, partial [Clostridia bacterium]|nr:CotH kinase family protein [Clostridia bacterium]